MTEVSPSYHLLPNAEIAEPCIEAPSLGETLDFPRHRRKRNHCAEVLPGTRLAATITAEILSKVADPTRRDGRQPAGRVPFRK